MNYSEKLQEALRVLQEELHNQITSYILSEERPVLKIEFVNSLVLYIRYNDFNEYSYQLNYSRNKYDRIRYDNYDRHWKISTTPHHLHERGKKNAIESPMKGIPLEDMRVLITILKPLLT